MTTTLRALQELLIEDLELVGKPPESLDPDASLFGTEGGLGFDSLDALQIAMSIEERFGVRIPEGEAAHALFVNLRTLANHIDKVKPSA